MKTNTLTKALVAAMLLLTAPFTANIANAQNDDVATFRTWAMTPPMGWNSWDCYFSSVNEEIVMQNARCLVDQDLVRHGWEYVVVDIRWYANHPSRGAWRYNEDEDGRSADCVLDEYGRYLPSPTRFPSCMVNGKNEGFKVMAESLHRMGLKLGIHIMRGLPKYILDNESKYKLKGAEDTEWSRVYTSTTPECTWLKDNLTVANNQYGQLYYDSLFELYASWGVDFIKIDDLSRPFHKDEIQMIRRAIDKCGRPIVLSLSPGKTAFKYADDCLVLANQWRMMDDLWDTWEAIDAVFAEADFWSQYTRPGNYADCDMIPFGQISATVEDKGYADADAGHWTRLSEDEQYTLMTLWGICHSPLFFGGEMTKNDAFTISLLNNDEYHKMHKYGTDSHQLFCDAENGHVAWVSTDPASGNKYLALFQRDTKKPVKPITVDLTTIGFGKKQSVVVYDIWQKTSVGKAKATFTATVPLHGAKLYRIGKR